MARYQTDVIPQEARYIRRTGRTGIARPSLIDNPDSSKKNFMFRVNNPVDTAPNFKYSLDGVQDESKVKKLQQLKTAYNIDGYVRQAVDKYAEKITLNINKVSDIIVTENEHTLAYLTYRLNLLSEGQNYPMVLFLTDVGRYYVRDGEVFIVKGYAKGSINIPGVSLRGVDGRPLIGGYFVVDTHKMVPLIDRDSGKTLAWVYRDVVNNKNITKVFPLDQVYHLTYCPDGLEGRGNSQNIPAIEDIRSLRNAEEAVLKLIYRHINPIIHVSTPDMLEDGEGRQEDVDLISQSISQMAHDGFIVTGPGVEMKSIGAESQALRAESYLNFFKTRSLSGLGMSALILGEGNYIGNAGANALAVQMFDRAKFYQKALSVLLTHTLLRDLLLEANISIYDTKTGELSAQLVFPDFDDDEKRKFQNHQADLYSKGVLSLPEVRKACDLPPLTKEDEEYIFQILLARTNARYETQVKGEPSQKKSKGNN